MFQSNDHKGLAETLLKQFASLHVPLDRKVWRDSNQSYRHLRASPTQPKLSAKFSATRDPQRHVVHGLLSVNTIYSNEWLSRSRMFRTVGSMWQWGLRLQRRRGSTRFCGGYRSLNLFRGRRSVLPQKVDYLVVCRSLYPFPVAHRADRVATWDVNACNRDFVSRCRQLTNGYEQMRPFQPNTSSAQLSARMESEWSNAAASGERRAGERGMVDTAAFPSYQGVWRPESARNSIPYR